VIPALDALGVTAAPAVWDDSTVRWAGYRLVVVRSTWDYSERRNDFLRWCAAVPRVLNQISVLTWNTNKVYLRELAAAGIPVVPTIWIAPGSPPAAVPMLGGEIVVKPAVSAGARNTSRFRPDDVRDARALVERLLGAGRMVMIQPYVASVDREGETALIYFDGVYSHAIRKGPLLQEPGRSTSELFAAEKITAAEPLADARALAEDTLDALAWSRDELLYARVDVVRDEDDAPMLLELELAEPSLFLAHGDGAAERFAAAIAGRL
jgi:glutathione synthase/RimK-type ligase-like ATP-grasp enzyme